MITLVKNSMFTARYNDRARVARVIAGSSRRISSPRESYLIKHDEDGKLRSVAEVQVRVEMFIGGNFLFAHELDSSVSVFFCL